MSRVFGRGQLKVALLQVADELGAANGYAIMQALDERVGGAWRPSPGAIYPALLALEDAGLLAGRDADGARTYAVTPAGRDVLRSQPDVVGEAAAKARSVRRPTTVGAVLDRLVAAAPDRGVQLGERAAARVEELVAPLLHAAVVDAVRDALAVDLDPPAPGPEATARTDHPVPTYEESPDG